MVKVQVEYASSGVLEAYVEVARCNYVNVLYQGYVEADVNDAMLESTKARVNWIITRIILCC